MSIVYLSIFFIFAIISYYVFIKPLIPIIMLKIKLGHKAIVLFYPIGGFMGQWQTAQNKYDDVMAIVNSKVEKNPQAQVILTNLFGSPLIMLISPDYIKNMFLEHEKYTKLDPFTHEGLISKGLVLSEGDSWKWQRKFLGNAFTFEKLKARIPMINEVVKDVMEKDSKDNLTIFTSKITGEVVIRSFFGNMAQGLQFEGKDAKLSIIDLIDDLITYPLANPYVLIKQLIFDNASWNILPTKIEKGLNNKIQNLRLLVKQLIEQKLMELKGLVLKEKAQTNNGEYEEDIFLDLYLKEYMSQSDKKHKIEMDEIVQQFLTLFFAGTDTTATTCSTSFYFLAKFQEFQEELYREIIKVIGDGDVTNENINQLQCVNAFLQEVLRLKNPAFMSLFRVVKQDTQMLDIKLKKNWLIFSYHNASSLLDKHFNNPNEFNYRRWLDNKNVIQNYNGFIHIPFGAGGRNCIGQHMALIEAKIILAQVIRKYQIILNPKVKKVQFAHKFLYCVEPDNCLLFLERK